MKKNFLYVGLMVLGIGMFLASCNDDNDTPNYTTNETTIASTPWLLTTVILTDTAGVDSSTFKDCMKDDQIQFKLNHDFAFTSGSLNCDGDSSIVPYGKGLWAFNLAEDSIALQTNDTTLHWTVNELTDSTLEISRGDSIDTDFYTKTLKFVEATPETQN